MKEKLDKIKEELSNQDLFIVHDVTSVNHKPHPYCITGKHITGESMYLDDNEIKRLESKNGCMCGMYVNGDKYANHNKGYGYHKCNIPYEEHTSDLVCFLKLSRNGTNDEANLILKELVDNLGENFIDGFSFIETEEKFRIINN